MLGKTHQYMGSPNILVNYSVPKVATYTNKVIIFTNKYAIRYIFSYLCTNFFGIVNGESINNLRGLYGKLGKASTTKID